MLYMSWPTHTATMTYTASSATSAVKWSRYSRMGAAYAEEVSPVRDGARLTLPCTDDDMGYVIEENGRSRYYWIINYARHTLDLESVTLSPEQDCDRTHLDFSGKAEELEAFSPLGRRVVVGRDLEVSYNTLEFDDESFSYHPVTTTVTLDGIATSFSVTAPLTDTQFTLSGDRFLKGMGPDAEHRVADLCHCCRGCTHTRHPGRTRRRQRTEGRRRRPRAARHRPT